MEMDFLNVCEKQQILAQRCIYAKQSLERKLETLDAFTAEWENCYSQILEMNKQLHRFGYDVLGNEKKRGI